MRWPPVVGPAVLADRRGPRKLLVDRDHRQVAGACRVLGVGVPKSRFRRAQPPSGAALWAAENLATGWVFERQQDRTRSGPRNTRRPPRRGPRRATADAEQSNRGDDEQQPIPDTAEHHPRPPPAPRPRRPAAQELEAERRGGAGHGTRRRRASASGHRRAGAATAGTTPSGRPRCREQPAPRTGPGPRP